MNAIKGFKNSLILTENGIVRTNLLIEGSHIAEIGGAECDGMIQLDEGKLVVPGFIDRHIHGAGGFDVMDGTAAALDGMARSLAGEGVTAFLATTTTQSESSLKTALHAVNAYCEKAPDSGAMLLGVHLEGPFITERFAGAQLTEYIAEPDEKQFLSYQQASGGRIRLVSMAVETEKHLRLVSALVGQGVAVSVGHTNATFDEVERAMKAGASGITHTFNAQRPFTHREAGTAGAALLLDGLYCEAICDGVHLTENAVRLLYRCKPKDKMVLISDALRAKGLQTERYVELGGQETIIKDGAARLPDGTLSGSILKMNEAVRNAKRFLGVPLSEAVRLATENAAKSLSVFDEMGSIAPGKAANLAVVDDDVNVYMTVRDGKIIYSI